MRPAQLPVLTEVRAPSLLEQYPRYVPHWDRAGYNRDTIPTSTQTVNLLIEKFCAIELRADKLASAEATAIIAHENYKKSNSMKVNSGKSMKSGADRAKQISLQQVQTWSLGCGVSSKAAACREQKW